MCSSDLERLPVEALRFTEDNTYPFVEAYYVAGVQGDAEATAKGDALLRAYADNIIEYIEYYLRFDGVQADLVADSFARRLDELNRAYLLANYAGRREIVDYLNDYYRSLGVGDEDLFLDEELTPLDAAEVGEAGDVGAIGEAGQE